METRRGYAGKIRTYNLKNNHIMNRKNIIHLVFTLLILIQSSFAFAQETMDESKVREEQAYTLGTSAYTWVSL